MSSPPVRAGRRPSLITSDDHFPLGTRSGALASLIRNRSQQSLAGSYHSIGHRYGPDDEEALIATPRGGVMMTREDEEIGKLLMDERRMTRILNGPQGRSMNLIGKSNPRYRWDRYWKHQHELDELKKPM